MKSLLCAVAALLVYGGICGRANADDKDVAAILDRAIEAAGGEAALAKAEVASMKAEGKLFVGGMGLDITLAATMQGLDKNRTEFEGDFNGTQIKGITVLNGEKGSRRVNDQTVVLDKGEVDAQRQNSYLQVAPMRVLPLKGKGFKLEAKGDEKVGGQETSVLKGTGPDGRAFTLWFDKTTGLPLKLSATVTGLEGGDTDEETTYSDYKDFGGIKVATKVESVRDGMKFIELSLKDFKVLEKADANAFDRPE